MSLVMKATKDFKKIFDETPNLIGIAKVVDDPALEAVAGNSVLEKKNQVAASGFDC